MTAKKSPSQQYKQPAKTSYGSHANVSESSSQTYSKPKKGKARAGMYDKYS